MLRFLSRVHKQLPEYMFKHINHDAIPGHLVLLTLRHSTVLYLVDVSLGYAHQAEAFSWGEFADAVGGGITLNPRSFLRVRIKCRRAANQTALVGLGVCN